MQKFKRSELLVLPEYFDRYINKTDDVTVAEAIETSIFELENAPLSDWEKIGKKVYARGKWTVNHILQHIIDTERIFSYRATAFARGDNEVKFYDEDAYARESNADERSIGDLIEEALCLRRSTAYLFRSFTDEMLQKNGRGFKGPYSVHSIGYIIPGHQRWHFNVIKEKYLPLT